MLYFTWNNLQYRECIYFLVTNCILSSNILVTSFIFKIGTCIAMRSSDLHYQVIKIAITPRLGNSTADMTCVRVLRDVELWSHGVKVGLHRVIVNGDQRRKVGLGRLGPCALPKAIF